MNSTRIVAAVAFAVSLFLLLDAWNKTQRPVPDAGLSANRVTSNPHGQASGETLSAAPAMDSSKVLEKGKRIQIATDLMVAEIDTVGGDIRRLEFVTHKDTFDQSKGFLLLKDDEPPLFVVQSGISGTEVPNHKSKFVEESVDHALKEGSDHLVIRLRSEIIGGLQLIKTYEFSRGSYLIGVSMEVANRGAHSVAPVGYFQLLRDSAVAAGESSMVPTFTGVGIYTDAGKYQKFSFSDLDKGKIDYPQRAEDGWIGFVQHYFVGAWVPDARTNRDYYAQALGNGLYRAGLKISAGAVEPGRSASIKSSVYVGPQEQRKLALLSPGLDLTVDYGWLTVIASPLFSVLSAIFRFVGNWGIAIIILTMLIKLLFYPLSATSYRSMAKMRVLAPKMQKLKEQFGDDRQKMQQSMMELYKTEKINPLGGCLPIVVQIPVFISLYWVLLGSVELRHAPFYGWIHDLSVKDPLYILPVLMGLTMILQTRLNPEPPDPVQAKVMKIMPIVFSVFFFFFPAGLVLYWLVNNILSIAQQWLITRNVEQPNATRPRR